MMNCLARRGRQTKSTFFERSCLFRGSEKVSVSLAENWLTFVPTTTLPHLVRIIEDSKFSFRSCAYLCCIALTFTVIGQKKVVSSCELFLPALAWLFCLTLPGSCLARFANFFSRSLCRWYDIRCTKDKYDLCQIWNPQLKRRGLDMAVSSWDCERAGPVGLWKFGLSAACTHSSKPVGSFPFHAEWMFVVLHDTSDWIGSVTLNRKHFLPCLDSHVS